MVGKKMADNKAGEKRQGMAEIFNRQAFLQRLDGDEELLGELLHIFSEHAQKQLQEMRQALAAGDALRLQGQAHSLKGAAASISAEALKEAAWQVELAGQNRPLEQAVLLLEALSQEFARLQEVLGKEGQR